MALKVLDTEKTVTDTVLELLSPSAAGVCLSVCHSLACSGVPVVNLVLIFRCFRKIADFDY